MGAATAAPMADHAAEFAAPFRACGIDLADVYYFGESVLLPEWRGHGIGHAFFDRREARARELGFPLASFCAVIRPADHPARPAGYSPLASLIHDARFQTRSGHLLPLAVLRGRPASLAFVSPRSD